MQQVVWNLVTNAIKFTPKGGTIDVTLSREESAVRIEVSDSGQGMDAELLPHVFDRFRQADSSSRRRFGGLGLGLSIVKQIVELHGGAVDAHSDGMGKGSTFTVACPSAQWKSPRAPTSRMNPWRRGIRLFRRLCRRCVSTAYACSSWTTKPMPGGSS